VVYSLIPIADHRQLFQLLAIANLPIVDQSLTTVAASVLPFIANPLKEVLGCQGISDHSNSIDQPSISWWLTRAFSFEEIKLVVDMNLLVLSCLLRPAASD